MLFLSAVFRNKSAEWCGVLLLCLCAAASGQSLSEAQFERARQADVQGESTRALEYYLDLSRDGVKDRFAALALFRAGELYTLKKDYKNAFASYQQLLDSKAEGDLFVKTITNQFTIAETIVRSTTAQATSADATPKRMAEGYQTAEKMLELILETARHTDFAPRAKFLISALQAKNGDKELARETLRSFLADYPSHDLVDDAEFQLAYYDYSDGIQGRGDFGPLERAENSLTYFLATYRTSDRQPVALALLKDIASRHYLSLRESAFYYEKTKSQKAAAKVFKEMVARYPEKVKLDKEKDLILSAATLPVDQADAP